MSSSRFVGSTSRPHSSHDVRVGVDIPGILFLLSRPRKEHLLGQRRRSGGRLEASEKDTGRDGADPVEPSSVAHVVRRRRT